MLLALLQLRGLLTEEEGQDLVEYGLLAAFIALAATAMLILIGPQIASMYSKVNLQLTETNAAVGS